MISRKTRKRRRAASAFSTPAFGRRPVVATPLPSAQSDFSLKIGRGDAAQTFVDDEANRVRPDVDDRERLLGRWRAVSWRFADIKPLNGHPAV